MLLRLWFLYIDRFLTLQVSHVLCTIYRSLYSYANFLCVFLSFSRLLQMISTARRADGFDRYSRFETSCPVRSRSYRKFFFPILGPIETVDTRVTFVDETFVKFRMFSTPTGSWIPIASNPAARRRQNHVIFFRNFVTQVTRGCVHIVGGFKYRCVFFLE